MTYKPEEVMGYTNINGVPQWSNVMELFKLTMTVKGYQVSIPVTVEEDVNPLERLEEAVAYYESLGFGAGPEITVAVPKPAFKTGYTKPATLPSGGGKEVCPHHGAAKLSAFHGGLECKRIVGEEPDWPYRTFEAKATGDTLYACEWKSSTVKARS